jgi:glycosyltransferase involved in cell wall biosynthesis
MRRTRVALLTLGDPDRMTGGYLFHRRMADRAANQRARLAFVSIPDLPLAWSLATGPAWLRDPALRAADVVVLDSIAAAAAAPWLGRIRVPIVGMLHQPPGGYGGRSLTHPIHVAFDRWAYRRAARLMVASDWLASELATGRRQRVEVVPPGKDPAPNSEVARDAEAPAKALTRARRGRGIAALCVANWLPTKGIAELLDAVAGLPTDLLTLHLVGDERRPSSYSRRLRRRLRDGDLRGRVVAHGILPPASVAALYRSVDVFVLPSFAETYGTVWGEAMAAGLPVIGWRAGNLPFLADHDREGLLVEPGDVAGLRAALAHLALAEGVRARMGAAAAARAAARPTWDETAERFFGVLAEVVALGES